MTPRRSPRRSHRRRCGRFPGRAAAIEWARTTRPGRPAARHLRRRPVPARDPQVPHPGSGGRAVRGAARVLDEAEKAARPTCPRSPSSPSGSRAGRRTCCARAARRARPAELVVGTPWDRRLREARSSGRPLSSHVAGHVPGPVGIVRHLPRPHTGEIVVGVDDSPAARPALAYAFEQARSPSTSAAGGAPGWSRCTRTPPASSTTWRRSAPRSTPWSRECSTREAERYPRSASIEDVRLAHPVAALVDASAGGRGSADRGLTAGARSPRR